MDARDREAERAALESEREHVAGDLRVVYQQAAEEITALRDEFATRPGKETTVAALDARLLRVVHGMDADAEEWAQDALTEAYHGGLELRQNDFDEQGVDVQVGFDDIHEATVAHLIDQFAGPPPEAPDWGPGDPPNMQWVNAYCKTKEHYRYNELAAAATAAGKLKGETVTETTQRLLDQFKTEGVKGFKDRSGREWDLVDYAYMAARTTAMLADNAAQENADLEAGFDLQRGLVAAGACDKCTPWDGVVVSITGATKGYPTKADWRASGAGHPHCTCAFVTVVEE